MRLSIRVSVYPDVVGIAPKNGAGAWEPSRPVADGDVRAAATQLLAALPRRRWLPRPSVVAVVGKHASRIKQLRGLPNMPGSRALESVVSENAQRFFLWDVPFVVTTLHRTDAGEAFGGIIAAPVVEAVAAACADAGYALAAVHPEADERLVFRPPRTSNGSAPVSRTRAVAAGVALSVAVVAAAVAPGCAAMLEARRAARELAALTSAERSIAEANRDRERSMMAIDAVARFERGRRPVTLLLAAIADALPDQSAITAVRVDTTGADLVVVSSRAAAVLGALDRVPGVVAPEIVGPVSREVAGARELERATIHFTYDPAAAATAARVAYAVRRDTEDDE